MKNPTKNVMLLLSLLVSIETYSQITIVPINKKILFNAYNSAFKDSIGLDIDNDTNLDLFIISEDLPALFSQAWFSYTSNTLNTNPLNIVYTISNLKQLGDPFDVTLGTGYIPFCEDYWISQNWPQSISDRYLGFNKVTMLDTTYGWIKLRYRAENFLDGYFQNDTIEVVEYAINNQLNDPITAGQTTPNTTNDITDYNSQVDIKFDNNNIVIKNNNTFLFHLSIYDLTGKTRLKKSILGNSNSIISMHEFHPGIYIISLENQYKSKLVQKIFKE